MPADRPVTKNRVHAPPHPVQVGQVYKRVGYLMANGQRTTWRSPRLDHTHIQIVQIPDGRKTTYRYVKLNPKPMGNGRADRQPHRIALVGLARNYLLVNDPPATGE